MVENRRMLEELSPNTKETSMDTKTIKSMLGRANKICNASIRYKALVERFGMGILGFIPATGGDCLNVSDAL